MQEINGTVYGLAAVLVNFQMGFDEKINWISHRVGGGKSLFISQPTFLLIFLLFQKKSSTG